MTAFDPLRPFNATLRSQRFSVATMKILSGVMIATCVLALGASSQAAVKPSVTDYCLVEPTEASSGGVSPRYIGDFIMKARLIIRGGHYDLKAWNVMPDNSQILAFEAEGTYQPRGPTNFRFIDNFDNHGRGSFKASRSEMRIEIERVRTAPGGENIGRNYGPNTLFRRGCKWEEPY